MSLIDAEGDALGDEIPVAAQEAFDATVNRPNGALSFARGPSLRGLSVGTIQSVADDGTTTAYYFLDHDPGSMSDDDFVRFYEQRGWPCPAEGLEEIRAIDLPAVAALSEKEPEVARFLRVLSLASPTMKGSSGRPPTRHFEVIKEDARALGDNCEALGWWSDKERRAFTGTANSVALLGDTARHGKRFDIPGLSMDHYRARWFLRRVAARWLAHHIESRT